MRGFCSHDDAIMDQDLGMLCISPRNIAAELCILLDEIGKQAT